MFFAILQDVFVILESFQHLHFKEEIKMLTDSSLKNMIHCLPVLGNLNISAMDFVKDQESQAQKDSLDLNEEYDRQEHRQTNTTSKNANNTRKSFSYPECSSSAETGSSDDVFAQT